MSSKNFPEGAIKTLSSLFSRLPKLRVFNLTLRAYEEGTPCHEFLLESLSHLTMLNVGWWSETTPPAQILSQISGTMGRCPELESFSFVIPSKYFFHGGPLVNFEEIFGPASTLPRGMKLASLEVHGVTTAASEFLRHIRHFRHLTKLHITFDPSSLAATNIGEILHLLAKDRIYLKDISVDAIHHPGVFDYLTSYSGIERLSLRPLHPGDDSPELLRRFFLSVLPTHSNSLRWLNIGGNLETEWSKALPRMYLREIDKCQLLEYICCWIIVPPEDCVRVRSETLVSDTLTIIRDFSFSVDD
jgi:hypothetical protein